MGYKPKKLGHLNIFVRHAEPARYGIEVSYEMPASQWGHDQSGYMIGGAQKGRLPGPWNEELAQGEVVRA